MAEDSDEPNYYTGRELPLSFYGGDINDKYTEGYRVLRQDILDKLAQDIPVFVSFTDERRRDSVGRITSIDMPWNARPRAANRWGTQTNGTQVYGGFDNIEVRWDGRKNVVRPHSSEIRYLPDWTDGTQWFWEQTVKPVIAPVIAHDHLGVELKVNDFVCFVHRRYGEITMRFGNVTRFTHKGGVFVKTIKLRDDDLDSEEVKALDASDVVIVDDKLRSRLVMARLATQ